MALQGKIYDPESSFLPSHINYEKGSLLDLKETKEF